jgi:hypothetical protein
MPEALTRVSPEVKANCLKLVLPRLLHCDQQHGPRTSPLTPPSHYTTLYSYPPWLIRDADKLFHSKEKIDPK